MPLPISLAHQLAKQLATVRKTAARASCAPTARRRCVRYRDGRPVAVEKLLITTQHAEGCDSRQIVDELWEPSCCRSCPPTCTTPTSCASEFLVNPTGRFVIGGPVGDCGLTGRKIIVDTYGGMARHGGGAFSGKDPSKVDRSAAYAARWVAKNLVAAGLADRCEVQVAYAIGVAHPVSVMVETFGTEKVAQGRDRGARRRALRPASGRASARSSTCTARSTRRPPPTATSAATTRTSRGSRPARPTFCATPPASAPRPSRSGQGLEPRARARSARVGGRVRRPPFYPCRSPWPPNTATTPPRSSPAGRRCGPTRARGRSRTRAATSGRSPTCW